jgi:hypothetical protein
VASRPWISASGRSGVIWNWWCQRRPPSEKSPPQPGITTSRMTSRRTASGCAAARGNRPAPIVTDEEEGPVPQLLGEEPPDVVGDGLFVVSVEGTRTVAEASQIRGDHGVMLGKGRDHVSLFPPGLGPAVQQDKGRPIAGDHIMDQHLAEVGVPVGEARGFGHRLGASATTVKARISYQRLPS